MGSSTPELQQGRGWTHRPAQALGGAPSQPPLTPPHPLQPNLTWTQPEPLGLGPLLISSFLLPKCPLLPPTLLGQAYPHHHCSPPTPTSGSHLPNLPLLPSLLSSHPPLWVSPAHPTHRSPPPTPPGLTCLPTIALLSPDTLGLACLSPPLLSSHLPLQVPPAPPDYSGSSLPQHPLLSSHPPFQVPPAPPTPLGPA